MLTLLIIYPNACLFPCLILACLLAQCLLVFLPNAYLNSSLSYKLYISPNKYVDLYLSNGNLYTNSYIYVKYYTITCFKLLPKYYIMSSMFPCCFCDLIYKFHVEYILLLLFIYLISGLCAACLPVYILTLTLECQSLYYAMLYYAILYYTMLFTILPKSILPTVSNVNSCIVFCNSLINICYMLIILSNTTLWLY